MPREHGVGLQVQVVHDIGVPVNLVLAASAHLPLQFHQEIKHSGVRGKLAVHRQGLHGHSHRMVETLVGTAVEHGREQRLLFVVVLGEQEAVGCGEQVAPEYTVLGAEAVHALHVHVKHPDHAGLGVLCLVFIGQERGEHIFATEIFCIPLLPFFKSAALTQLRLVAGQLAHGVRLGGKFLPVIGRLDVVQQD